MNLKKKIWTRDLYIIKKKLIGSKLILMDSNQNQIITFSYKTSNSDFKNQKDQGL